MQLQGRKPIGLWLSTQINVQYSPSLKRKHPSNMTTLYILHNHILKPVTSAKYLGVTLQSNLKWNTHIDIITSNGNKSLGYLKRNLQISNPEVKSRAYQALVRPKLEYSCSIWDPYTHDNIPVHVNKLEMVQRRAARYVQNNYHNTSSVTSMIDTLDWPTLAELSAVLKPD
jgi:hypothetical protein